MMVYGITLIIVPAANFIFVDNQGITGFALQGKLFKCSVGKGNLLYFLSILRYFYTLNNFI
jgi:hypothetical protein